MGSFRYEIKATHKNHFDDEIFLIGTLESIVFWEKNK